MPDLTLSQPTGLKPTLKMLAYVMVTVLGFSAASTTHAQDPPQRTTTHASDHQHGCQGDADSDDEGDDDDAKDNTTPDTAEPEGGAELGDAKGEPAGDLSSDEPVADDDANTAGDTTAGDTTDANTAGDTPEPGALTDEALAAHERFYQQGWERLGRNDWRGAVQSFERCAQFGEQGPRTALCREMQLQSERIAEARFTDAPPSGNVELILYSTAFGIWTGAALSVAGEVGENSLLISGASGLAGLGVGYLVSRIADITPGQAAMVTLGGNAGTWNGIAWFVALSEKGFIDSTDILVPLAAGYAGIGTAALLAPRLKPSSGDVALASSGALWGTFLAGMGLLIADIDEFSTEAFFTTLVLGTDIGIAAGALAASQVDLSRARVNLVDLGGTLGALVVGGVLLSTEAESPQAVGASLSAGALAGGALTLYLTRNMDRRSDQSAARPIDGLPTLEAPTVFVRPHATDTGQVAVAAGLDLFHGRF